MNHLMNRIGVVVSLVFTLILSSCRYDSFLEAQIACANWEQKRPGVIVVEFDGDDNKGRERGKSHASGKLIQLRQCIHAKGMGHIIGRELLTTPRKILTKVEYSKIVVRHALFWFN